MIFNEKTLPFHPWIIANTRLLLILAVAIGSILVPFYVDHKSQEFVDVSLVISQLIPLIPVAG
ncbi:MAG: hypothetical protein ACJAVI_005036 [Candidatus Azotimanducaceae bacterium]